MQLVDTHSHLFVEEFQEDRSEVMTRAFESGVNQILLPNIDEDSVNDMLALSRAYPGQCFPMIGIHPTSVKKNYREQVAWVAQWLEKETFYGIGEIGIDLYWDTSLKQQQMEAFALQIELARRHHLPFVIHARNSYDEIFEVLNHLGHQQYKGIFHSFTADIATAQKAIALGFKLGMGGIATFKNAGVDQVIKQVPIEHLVLETDSPYLAPTPKRGKRNESSFITYINKKLAELHEISPEQAAAATTKNARALFSLP